MYGSTTPKLTERDTDCGWMLLYPSGMMINLVCFPVLLVLDLGWKCQNKSERILFVLFCGEAASENSNDRGKALIIFSSWIQVRCSMSDAERLGRRARRALRI